jgi:hypothetical protein
LQRAHAAVLTALARDCKDDTGQAPDGRLRRSHGAVGAARAACGGEFVPLQHVCRSTGQLGSIASVSGYPAGATRPRREAGLGIGSQNGFDPALDDSTAGCRTGYLPRGSGPD